MTEKSDWTAILSAFLVGVAGAIQVGRVAPVASALQADLYLDLATLGWLVSLITLASALLGLVAGHWVIRAGLRRSIFAGAVLMGLCAIVSALAQSLPVLIGARIAEGVGYLVVVVAAPTLIVREAAAKDMPLALAVWGTFFTLGLSISAIAGGAVLDLIGWRGWFLASAALVVVAALAARLSMPADTPRTGAGPRFLTVLRTTPNASWLLGAAFLGVTLLSLSILSLLPAYLAQARGLTPGAAGAVTGGVALASIGGSLSYGMLANRLRETFVASVTSLFLVAAAFLAFASAASTLQVVAFASVAIFMSGVLVAQTFAAIPGVAGSPTQIATSNGLVAQLGSVGALIGPPMVAALISVASWNAVPLVVAGFTLSFAVLFGLALKSGGVSRAAAAS
ncbi:MAG: MFS transporter [Maritimibacter sp.]|nr:MFS transporter [Maritimibacter sp.]